MGLHDLDTAERVEVEQVAIAGHHALDVPGEGCFEELVVVRVSIDGVDLLCGIDELGEVSDFRLPAGSPPRPCGTVRGI